ncbi:hypothetical protein PENTCL1PPCAC_7594, partial [Pristionchus entomophagus]
FQLLDCDLVASIIPVMECLYNNSSLIYLWGAALFFGYFLLIIAISLHTYRLIRLAQNLSTKTKSYHRTMLVSLMLMAAVPITVIVIPFAVAMAYIFVRKENLDVPVLDIANVVIAFHSVVHSLVLIMTTPIFRKRVIEMFCAKERVLLTP